MKTSTKKNFQQGTILLMVILLMAGGCLSTHADDFETATQAVANMKIGWNLGNTLDCHSGDTTNMWIEAYTQRKPSDYETAWGQPATTLALIKMMKEAGFNTIRIPVTWYPHMEADFKNVNGNHKTWSPSAEPIGTRIDADWMARVKEVVDYVISQGMYCILNVHHDTGDANTTWLVADKDVYAKEKSTFEAIWTQIANTFKDYDEHLLFEGYNEMLDIKHSWCFASFNTSNKYDAQIATSAYAAINSYAQSFVNAVRATGGNNAQRNLIISPYAAASGSGNWNTHLQDPLKQLTLPTDQAAHHLAVEVHDYKDMTKLQAAKNEVDEEISIWKQYFLSRGVPVIVGEWGASQNEDYSIYQKYRSNLLSYARYFVEKTKAAGIATLYWMGLSDGTARSVPEFNQADLKDQIIKGYYGENGYTGIHNLMATPSRKDDSTVYTITGQKVSDKTEQLPAGIYIRGGHKFVVR